MFSINFIKEFFCKFRDVSYRPTAHKSSWSVPQLLKRSLKLRVVDAGDDEGTMAELYALEWPQYSLESYGIFFTASPKHADGVVVVWAITRNMEKALKAAYDVIPNPKIIIACGDKAIHGDKRFPEIVGGTQEVLGHVDLEIPGNPPTAKEILSYLASYIQK